MSGTSEDTGISVQSVQREVEQGEMPVYEVPGAIHTVNANGIQPIQDKVKAIRKAPPPTNITELQSFLGVLQYYVKFVPNLSTVLHPLYERLKAGVEWSWDSSCDEAFNQCKSLLSSETVLTHYDGSKPLILATGANSYGVGAMIMIKCQMVWKNPSHLHQDH